MNHLYYGDNLTIMQRMPKHCVDLIYLDPPFNSKQNYNLIYKNMTGKPVPDQADAFCDTWDMDPQKEELAKAMPVLMREHGIADYYVEFWRLWINALRHTQPHLLAYLIYMVQRMLYMKSILRPTGSIYLHCDPTASHYIKVMMDGIFGHKNFQNEIIWKRTSAHNSAKRWGPVHDVILFYSYGDKYTWNKVYQAYDDDYTEAFYRHKDDSGKRYRIGDLTGAGTRQGESGEAWRGINPTDKGRHWAPPRKFPGGEHVPKTVLAALDYLDSTGRIYWPAKDGGVPGFKRYLEDMEGVQIQDIIDDISPISAHGKERLGYPTQKPVALLRRIISASTNKGDVVFDPFCGCGTTIYAAQELERKWIGCDIAILSVKIMREVLTGEKYRLTEGKNFKVDGIPVSVEQAEELFKRDPFQFEHWLVERVGGFPTKKTGDKGIDGRMYFETKAGLKAMVLSVKGGNIRPTDVRDLRGVLEREHDTAMAGFLCLKEPTKAMKEEAATAGQYEYAGVKYDRLQLLTVKDILEGKREFHTPTKMGSRIASPQHSLPL
ncbi:MAG: site-specific DNA-methyltransferase [Alphaproteobacteria bacterium]|nr:site-specific DNA-methyltransferase [Alphaproteobacteria bacterium]